MQCLWSGLMLLPLHGWAAAGIEKPKKANVTNMAKYRVFINLPPRILLVSAARRSWVLRGVILGFSEEARTRGFPSLPFGGFGFVVIECRYVIRLFDTVVLMVNSIRNVRFGSLADLFTNFSLMSGFGWKADVQIA